MTSIAPITKNAALNIALDTIAKKKQSLIFVGSKKSAEKTAEDLSKHVRTIHLEELSEKVLKCISAPTQQCKRLAACVRKGIAFHHAGLQWKQKELIEDAFRDGVITTIACTPTLCLSQDSMIWHGMQETEVFKLKKSHQLFAFSNTSLQVMKSQKVQKIENSSKLIKISSTSGHSIKVTPHHKILIKRKGKTQLLSAIYIQKNDKIATIGKLQLQKVRVPSIHTFVIDNEYLCIDFKFSPSLSYFIGAMLGDGYSGAEIENVSIMYKGSPCIVGIDDEIFQSVKDVCIQLTLFHKTLKNYNGTPQMVLSKQKWFREFLVRCGVEKGEKKHISTKLMYMNLENIAALLRGLFDTAGCVEKIRGVSFSNVSLTLIKQIQKQLLRFGIVSRLRKKKASTMKVYKKEYQTVDCYEIGIYQKRSILDFQRHIGFNVERKKKSLKSLVNKIHSNIHYYSCKKCNYKIYKDLFEGRTKSQHSSGRMKYLVIKSLAISKELRSRELKKKIGCEPKSKVSRANHHYELINKRRIGARSSTEWLWSLNTIGKWIYNNILSLGNPLSDFFELHKCPLCFHKFEKKIKKGSRDQEFEGDIFWDTIRSIKETKVEKWVYDVVLPNQPKNDHLFIANGFLVHNSAGIDMPAFRTIIKDVKRFSGFGSNYIPVLEYLQMAGRAGRPGKEDYGEAIVIAGTESMKDELLDRYINGVPEEIYSKLAVEPVLRTYVLSLIATRFVRNQESIVSFFNGSFWAFQFQDMEKLSRKLQSMTLLLQEYAFIHSSLSNDFVNANEEETYSATPIGKRVSELYLDPLTAHYLLESFDRYSNHSTLAILQMLSWTLEMRPLLRVKVKDLDWINQELLQMKKYLSQEPMQYDSEYDEFLESMKTALCFEDWLEECDEEFLLQKYDIRPGELHAKLDRLDWLLYASIELTRMAKQRGVSSVLTKLRLRLQYGVKEELLPLLQLKGIGRIRARTLFKNGIRDIKAVKKVDNKTLSTLLGTLTALSIKEQVGLSFDPKNIIVKKNKRKGQISLKDF